MPSADQASKGAATERPRLNLTRHFTTGNHPFNEVVFESRTARIDDRNSPDAPPVFEQRNVSFPVFWSQNAINIATEKYFAYNPDDPMREWSLKQMIGRVVETIGKHGRADGYFADEDEAVIFEHELAYILLHQMAAFNSPVWFNIGVEGVPQQCSACFILHIEDNLTAEAGITNWLHEESVIFQNGSGAGLNLSALRASNEQLSRGGKSSGPVTFMRAADANAGTITSGGRTRRAAKMVVLDVDHPDIEDFIWCKAHEEKKARALAAAGFDMSLNTPEGERNWASIQYQNANNSVRLSDEFLTAVVNDAEWALTARTTGETVRTVKARDLMRQIADATWQCADPGVQYDTTINDWHTCPNHSPITASNPCSEYMHVDNSSCNLASLNLMRFRREDGTFNVEAFQHASRIVFLAQEILISFGDYPTEAIAHNTRAMRQIGLGYANLGAYLMSIGLPYDSKEGRDVAAAITALMHGTAYHESARIAAVVGPYDEYANNKDPQLRVLRKHRAAANKLDAWSGDLELTRAAKRIAKDMVALAEINGVRNAQATVLAPTGTISFLMDCDTTGIEPDFALTKYKALVGGGTMQFINSTVPLALERLGYTSAQQTDILAFIEKHNTVIGAPHMDECHHAVFATAVGENAISYRGHLRMMGACQPFLSGAISKTVNLPEDATVDDIYDTYVEAWRLNLKAVAIYRNGTKTAQPLSDGKDSDSEAGEKNVVTSVLGDGLLRGQRRRVPDDGKAIKRRFEIYSSTSGKVSGHITVGLFEDGTPGEVFVNVGQAGSTVRGFMDLWSRVFSLALQYGAPLDDLVSKQAFTQFEPAGFTNDAAVRSAKSIPDYVVRWMALKFLDEDSHMMLGINTPPVVIDEDDDTVVFRPAVEVKASVHPAQDKPKATMAGTGTCGTCGGLMQQTGKCMTCLSCGETGGCG